MGEETRTRTVDASHPAKMTVIVGRHTLDSRSISWAVEDLWEDMWSAASGIEIIERGKVIEDGF